MNKAIFLDRDGTLNKMVLNENHGYLDSPFTVGNFVLVEHAKEFVEETKKQGFTIIIVSNQPSISKGTLKIKDLNEMTELMCNELQISKNQVYYCNHKSEDNCTCRKPRIGLFEQAQKEHNIDLKNSFVIGDGWNDVVAGKTIGAKTILIGRKDRTELVNLLVEKNAMPDFFVKNIIEVLKILMGDKNGL